MGNTVFGFSGQEARNSVTIIGAGHVGLVSGCCFAEFGASVTFVDLDESRVAALKEGRIPIQVRRLGQLLAANADAGRLNFNALRPRLVVQGESFSQV